MPLDPGGWLRRAGRAFRRNLTILMVLGGALALLTIAFRIGVELTAPSPDDIGRELIVAGQAILARGVPM